ncbi:hypothetical protein V8E52_004694 [Russula decolorans]
MDETSWLGDDPTRYPLPPDIATKSTDISQNFKLREPGSHRAISGRTSQTRLSYAAAAHERPDGAASASPAAPSGQPSRTRESRPLDNQPTARPAVASSVKPQRSAEM